MPSPTQESSVDPELLELARKMFRPIDLPAHARIRRAKARVTGCLSALVEIMTELGEITGELEAARPDLLEMDPPIFNMESPAAVAAWRPGDTARFGSGGLVETDVERDLVEQVRFAGGYLPSAGITRAVEDLESLVGRTPRYLEEQLARKLETLAPEQVARIRASLEIASRECKR